MDPSAFYQCLDAIRAEVGRRASIPVECAVCKAECQAGVSFDDGAAFSSECTIIVTYACHGRTDVRRVTLNRYMFVHSKIIWEKIATLFDKVPFWILANDQEEIARLTELARAAGLPAAVHQIMSDPEPVPDLGGALAAGDVFDDATEQWGKNFQYLMFCEESAELTIELTHLIRGRGDEASAAEEIADVTLMCMQLRRTFGEKAIDAVIQRKLARLRERIEKSKNEQP